MTTPLFSTGIRTPIPETPLISATRPTPMLPSLPSGAARPTLIPSAPPAPIPANELFTPAELPPASPPIVQPPAREKFVSTRVLTAAGVGGVTGLASGALIGKLAGNTKKGALYGTIAGIALPIVSERARSAAAGLLFLVSIPFFGAPQY